MLSLITSSGFRVCPTAVKEIYLIAFVDVLIDAALHGTCATYYDNRKRSLGPFVM